MKAVRTHAWGGPENLTLDEIPEPQAGPGQVRVRVSAVSLNPADAMAFASEQIAGVFGLSLPAGFANDFSGVVDQVGEGDTGFSVGDRVFGWARARAAAEYVLVTPPEPGTARSLHGDELYPTPDGVDDQTAATMQTAGLTADAAVATVAPGPDDTVLIGGAAGGVGVYAVQLAKATGARVLGTASPATFDFLRDLGAEPIADGDGLADRVEAAAPDGITAAIDLFGKETAQAALDLGVPADRIAVVAAHDPEFEKLVTVTGSLQAPTEGSTRLAELLAAGTLRVPIAAAFPVEYAAKAAEALLGRHTHGKIIVTF